LPSTPALAILVVLVMTDCSAPGAGLPPVPHPLMTVTETAVRMAVAETTRPTRGPLISTSPTVTSGLFGAGQAANL
jgi:hypothetical protein